MTKGTKWGNNWEKERNQSKCWNTESLVWIQCEYEHYTTTVTMVRNILVNWSLRRHTTTGREEGWHLRGSWVNFLNYCLSIDIDQRASRLFSFPLSVSFSHSLRFLSLSFILSCFPHLSLSPSFSVSHFLLLALLSCFSGTLALFRLLPLSISSYFSRSLIFLTSHCLLMWYVCMFVWTRVFAYFCEFSVCMCACVWM